MVAFLISRQRSGTGALGSILDQNDALAYLGEVLHPDDHSNPGNFFRFVKSSPVRTEDYMTPSTRFKTVRNYFAFLMANSLPKVPVLDIKYQSLHHWNQGWQGLLDQPWLIRYIKQEALPVIHLVRENLVSTYVSGRLADANQTWHTADLSKIVKTSLTISTTDLKDFLEDASRERGLVSEWLSTHNNLLTLYYESLFDEDGNLTQESREQVAGLLKIPQFKMVRATWLKQAPIRLSDSIENFDEVSHSLHGTQFQWMITGQRDTARKEVHLPSERDNAGGATTPTTSSTETETNLQIAGVAALPERASNLEPESPERIQSIFESLPEAFAARVEARRRELIWLSERGVLPAHIVQSEWVLDWECGDCAFAVAMLLLGARRVIASDTWLDQTALPSQLHDLRCLATAKLDIAGVAESLAHTGISLDLIFSNTVTEHIPDLPSSLTHVRRSLRPGGYFFTNHDNYFQPAGSHDHGFLFYGTNLEIVFQGVRCWESAQKCLASADHRERIVHKYPWTISPLLEQTRNPTDCGRCFYFRRSQPWAHLLNQEEFRTYFGNPGFTTGRPNSALNKITLFQLRQFVVEANMDIIRFDRTFVANDPPEVLLQAPFFFSPEDLRTCMATLLARAV